MHARTHVRDLSEWILCGVCVRPSVDDGMYKIFRFDCWFWHILAGIFQICIVYVFTWNSCTLISIYYKMFWRGRKGIGKKCLFSSPGFSDLSTYLVLRDSLRTCLSTIDQALTVFCNFCHWIFQKQVFLSLNIIKIGLSCAEIDLRMPYMSRGIFNQNCQFGILFHPDRISWKFGVINMRYYIAGSWYLVCTLCYSMILLSILYRDILRWPFSGFSLHTFGTIVHARLIG